MLARSGHPGLAMAWAGGAWALLAQRSRPRRVLLLAGVIAALSAIDLHLTILYASTTGMAEANPLARAIMSSGSPTDLMLWKGATVGLCVALLAWTRRAPAAEIGAWLGVAVLGWLMLHWAAYARETHKIATIAGAIEYDSRPEFDPRWVQLELSSAAIGRP